MNIRSNVSLRDFSTMRLGGTAAHVADVSTKDELIEVLTWAEERQLPVVMIGGGSNIVWKDEGFPGLLLINKLQGFTLDETEPGVFTVTAGSGEVWDSVVERTVAEGLTGIEALSLIPGSTGATPIQNVGAYGQEISQTLVNVEAYDRQAKQFVTIAATDCDFAYRRSRFNRQDRGRFLIVSISLQLRRGNPQPPYYRTVEQYFADHNITGECTPHIMRDAVIAIRRSKLPDPAQVANNGSFFGNPIVDGAVFERLKAEYGDTLPAHPLPDGRAKLSAAWMIDQVGLKDYHDAETGMATWAAQPLVFVNEHAESTSQLLAFRQKVLDAVHQKFGVTLKQEPELLP